MTGSGAPATKSCSAASWAVPAYTITVIATASHGDRPAPTDATPVISPNAAMPGVTGRDARKPARKSLERCKRRAGAGGRRRLYSAGDLIRAACDPISPSLPTVTLTRPMTTTAAPAKETLGFQAEVKQLLHLMVHSLYGNKEVFLRELVSNASDAADKLRFEAIADPSLLAGDAELKIRIAFDKDARTITVSDNGVGMSRDETIANIGT